MPSPEETLLLLSAIANGAYDYAIAWHVVILVGLLTWSAGHILPRRADAVLRSSALVSVSVFAWCYGVAFNALVFAALSIGALVLSLRSRSGWRAEAPWAQLLGALLFAFGWVYPHFLDASHGGLAYLYAAPLGLLPCPTLAFLIGLDLLAGAPAGRLYSRVVAGAGVFYGAWGALRLGVWLDLVLLAGALGLLIATLRSQLSAASESRPAPQN